MSQNTLVQLANNNSPHTIVEAAGTTAVVHCKHNSTNDAYLYGSLIDPTSTTIADWVLIEHFTASTIKEITLPNYLILSANGTDLTTDVNSGTTVRISYGK
jgi:hypothetical protein